MDLNTLADLRLDFADNNHIYTSRHFMAYNSPVFYAMFTGEYKERNTNVLTLPDDYTAFDNIINALLNLDSCYHDIEVETFKNILIIIDKYQFERLSEVVSFNLINTVTALEVLDILINFNNITAYKEYLHDLLHKLIDKTNVVEIFNKLIENKLDIKPFISLIVTLCMNGADNINKLNNEILNHSTDIQFLSLIVNPDNEARICDIILSMNVSRYDFKYVIKIINNTINFKLKLKLYAYLCEKLMRYA